ncbi:MAG: response regulator transcription factor [Bacteroidetes bacterium]|nr:response regulator transcription factor [Bacteroidota bacterium]
MIRVFLVDDHKILAQALIDFLGGQEDMKCVGIVHSGTEALEVIPKTAVDVVLMDIGLPGMDGISCCEALLKINDQLKIIGLSTHLETSIVKRLFKAGATGYVSKAADLKELPVAIRKIHEGRTYLGEIVRQNYLDDLSGQGSTIKVRQQYLPKLTRREKEVLGLIAREMTTEEIGQELFISSNTVQTHRKNLISKFGVRNSVGLVLKALELQLI